MNHFAVRPSIAFHWKIVDTRNGKTYADALKDRQQAIRITQSLNANRIKREEANAAGL